MTSLSKVIRNFFGTTRAQTNGFVVLLVVMAFAIFSQPLARWWVSTQPQDFSKDSRMLDSLTRQWKVVQTGEHPVAVKPREYFHFDPNTLPEKSFIALGFSEQLAARISRYRNKNGKFRIKADLLKLYGMDTVLYRQVYPYIQLPEELMKPEREKKLFTSTYSAKPKPDRFDLNQADTTQLEKIYGIGPRLAARIVKYREKLGGFVSAQQLKEVYGLDSVVVNNLIERSYVPDQPIVKTINLNTADEKTLAAHPYFGRKLASAIVAYRFQHGNFKSVDDLGKIPLMDKNNLGKVLPYVTVDP